MSGQEVHAISNSSNQNSRTAGRSSQSQYAAKDVELASPQARQKHHFNTKTQECDQSASVGTIRLQVLNALLRVNSESLVIDGTILLRNLLVKLLHVMNYRSCQSNQILNQDFS